MTIHPGQTFCVVTSAVPGETTITAYAPGVFNWESGRVVTKLVWGEGRFRYPASAVVRAGSEHTLTTLINAFIVYDGESNWIEGVALIGLYGIIAAAFWWG